MIRSISWIGLLAIVAGCAGCGATATAAEAENLAKGKPCTRKALAEKAANIDNLIK